MHNKDIRLEWVPLAYKDVVKKDGKAVVKAPPVTITLYSGKGINLKQGFKRKIIR